MSCPASERVDHLDELPAVPDLAAPPADAQDLRAFFRRHAAGVAVITATHAGRPVGLLVTSLASVSGEPPLVSFNVALTSSSWPALAHASHLGVHVLGADQHELAGRFARKGADRFAAPTAWEPGPHGVPLLTGAAARSVVLVERRIPVADHVIVVGRLLSTDVEEGATPLLHHDGDYHQVAPRTRLSVVRSAAARSGR